MKEMTVYLTDDLQRELERIAAEQGRSEAELIVAGIRQLIGFHAPQDPPLPSFGIFDSGDPDFAAKTEELLEGFGER